MLIGVAQKKMRLILRTFILAILGACNSQPMDTSSSSGSVVVQHVKPNDFKNQLDEGGCILLDVRTQREIGQGFIETASFINYPNESFEQKANLMDRETPILVYCHSGGRSAKAAQVLVDMGFQKVYNLEGGIRGWKSEGMPITAAAEPITASRTTSKEVLREVLDSNEWVLVDFYTPWCAPCKKLNPILKSIQDNYADSLTIIKVDADASSALAEQYNVVGVPVLVLLQNGEEVWRNNGWIDEADLRSEIDKYCK